MDSAYKKNIKRYSNVVKIARHMLNLMVLFVPSTHIYYEAIVEGCYSLSQLMMYFQNIIINYSLGDSSRSTAISSRTSHNTTMDSSSTSTSGSTSESSNNPPETTTPDNHPSTHTQRSNNASFSSKLLREIPICLSFIEVFCEKLICLFFGFHGQSQLIFIIELIKAVSRLTLLMRTNACTMTIHWIQEVDSQGNILDLYNYARHYQRVVYHYLNQQKQKQYDAQRYLSYSHSAQRNNAQNQNQNQHAFSHSNSNYDFGSFTSSSNHNINNSSSSSDIGQGDDSDEVLTPTEPYVGRRTGIKLASSIPKSIITGKQSNIHPQSHSPSIQQQQTVSVTSSVTEDIHNNTDNNNNTDNDHGYSLSSSCETSPHKSLVHLQSLRQNQKNNSNCDSNSSSHNFSTSIDNNNRVKRALYDKNDEENKDEDDEGYKAYIRNYDENFIRSSFIHNNDKINSDKNNSDKNSHDHVKVNGVNDMNSYDMSTSNNSGDINVPDGLIASTTSTVATSTFSNTEDDDTSIGVDNDNLNNIDDIIFNGGSVGNNNNNNNNSDSLIDMNTCITLSESNSFLTADDTYITETAISSIIDTAVADQNDRVLVDAIPDIIDNNNIGDSNSRVYDTTQAPKPSAATTETTSATASSFTTSTNSISVDGNSPDDNTNNNNASNNTTNILADFLQYIAGLGIDFTQLYTISLLTIAPSVKSIYTTSLHTAPLAALQFTQTMCKKSHQNVLNLYDQVTCYKFPLNASQCLQLGEILYILRPLIYVWVRHTLNDIKLKKMNKQTSENNKANNSSSTDINANDKDIFSDNTTTSSTKQFNTANNTDDNNNGSNTPTSSSTASDYCEDSKSYQSLVALAVSLVVELLSIQLSSYGLTLIRREVYKNSVHMFSQQYSTSDFDKTQLPSDLPSSSSSPLHSNQQQQQHKFDLELRRRKQALFYYLIRSPVFDRSLLPLFKMLSRSLKCIPLINTLPDYVLSALVYMNNSHFRSSASSSSSF